MQKLSAIFIVALMTMNVVFSMKFNAIDASMLPSNSIRSTLNSILVQVQNTDSPKTIKQFMTTIRDMLTKLQSEQREHQEIATKMKNQCENEDKFRKAEIAEANDANNRAVAAKAKCQESLDETRADLPGLKEALEDYQAELKRATEQRAKEHAEYLRKQAAYKQAIEFLTDFIAKVKSDMSNFKAFSFAQKAQVVLRHASKLGVMQHAVPVLVALASKQVPTDHNDYAMEQREDLASRLNTALTTLLERIQADNQENEDVEAAAVAAFEKLKAMLEANIKTLQDNIARAEEQIELMEKCVADEDAIIASATAKLNRNTRLMNAAKGMCDTFAKEFIEATKARLEEMKTVREVIEICETKFKDIPKDLVGYLESVQDGFEAYVNSTEFQKFVEYEQNHIANNEHGESLADEENHVTDEQLAQ